MNTAQKPDNAVWQLLVVDDQEAFWRVAEQLFAGCSQLRLAGAVGSDREAAAWIERHSPDAVLIDVNVPERGGFALAAALKARGNRVAPILTSASNQAIYRQLAARAGALAFVEKGALSAERVVALLAGRAARGRSDYDG